MNDGFGVTMADLLAAADAFRAAGEEFGGLMPASGPAPPDGGNWVINDALSQVLKSVGILHTQLAGVVGNDAERLAATHREYQSAEDTISADVRGIPSQARPNR